MIGVYAGSVGWIRLQPVSRGRFLTGMTRSSMSSPVNTEAAIPALEAYAAAGGVVWVQGAIQGSDPDEDCYPLPFGGQSCIDFGETDPIVDPSDPMVQGVPNPIMGNFASHVADTCLPAEAHVVVVNGNDDNPVLYELRDQAPLALHRRHPRHGAIPR